MKRNSFLFCIVSFLILIDGRAQIGIGTTSPDNSAVLDIFANPATPRGLLIPRLTTSERTGITSPAAGLLIYNKDTDVFQYWDGTQWLDISSGAVSGDNDWTVDNGGAITHLTNTTHNVGIGTASPVNKLHVEGGAITVRRDVASAGLYSNTYGGYSILALGNAQGTITSPAATSAGTLLGRLSFRGYNGTNFVEGAYVEGKAEGLFSGSQTPANLIFHTTPTGSTVSLERMRITAGGSVGIGISTPEYTLHVANGIGVDRSGSNAFVNIRTFANPPSRTSALQFLRARGTQSSPAAVNNNRVIGEINFKGYDGSGYPIGASIQGISQGNFSTSSIPTALVFKTAQSPGSLLERMRITSTGNVGIGINAPVHLLELSTDDAAKPGTSAWTVTSDERLKNITGGYQKGLREILALQPIKYYYKNTETRKFAPEVLRKEFVGFSAQEVQKIFPEAVKEAKDGYLTLNIHAILIAYVNAIKELSEKNQKLEFLIANQAQRIKRLEKQVKRISQLEAEIEKLHRNDKEVPLGALRTESLPENRQSLTEKK